MLLEQLLDIPHTVVKRPACAPLQFVVVDVLQLIQVLLQQALPGRHPEFHVDLLVRIVLVHIVDQIADQVATASSPRPVRPADHDAHVIGAVVDIAVERVAIIAILIVVVRHVRCRHSVRPSTALHQRQQRQRRLYWVFEMRRRPGRRRQR